MALLFLDHGNRRWWGVIFTPRPLFYPRVRTGTHYTEGCVGPRAGLDGFANLAPTGIRSPDRPVRSQSLFRLRYPARIRPLRSQSMLFSAFWNSLVVSFSWLWTFRERPSAVSKRCTPNTLCHSMTSVNIWHVIHTAEWNVNDHVQKTPSMHPTLTEINFVHLKSTAFSQAQLFYLLTQLTKLHVSANCTPFLR